MSAIYVADYLLIPIQLDLLAIKGAQDISEKVVPPARNYYNPHMNVLGVIVNKYKKTRSQRLAKEAAKNIFGGHLFENQIQLFRKYQKPRRHKGHSGRSFL